MYLEDGFGAVRTIDIHTPLNQEATEIAEMERKRLLFKKKEYMMLYAFESITCTCKQL